MQIDYWLEYACNNVVAGANFEAVCNGINDYLALRTYVIGHNLTVADLALWGQLQGEALLRMGMGAADSSVWLQHWLCAWPTASILTKAASLLLLSLCFYSRYHVEEGAERWQGALPVALVRDRLQAPRVHCCR